jgi:exopolysaccharide biosynthesis polyprenyl glycosylphosphotransferase
MIRRHIPILKALLMIADAAVAALVLVSVYTIAYSRPGAVDLAPFRPAWVAVTLYAATWVLLLYLEGEYRLRAHWTLRSDVRGVARATVLLALVFIAGIFVTELRQVSRLLVFTVFPLQFAATVVTRAVLRWTFEWLRGRGRNNRFLLIVGTNPAAVRFAERVERHRELGVQVIGFVGDAPPAAGVRWPWLGPADGIGRVLEERIVDEVALCLPASEWPDSRELLEMCTQAGKIVRIPLDIPRLGSERQLVEDLDGTPVISVVQRPDQALALTAKRAFDIGVSAFALVLLAPLIAGIALYVRRKGGSPVLYRQERIGIHGRPFTMLKFRTMAPDADDRYDDVVGLADARGFKLHDDPRVMPWGRWLRRTGLDELPQLINVMRGDMSIVGPRPAPAREVVHYDMWHRRRLSMKPGITGLWQVGRRFDDDFDERARLDLDYIDRWSLWLDLRIVVRTVPAVLRQSGR